MRTFLSTLSAGALLLVACAGPRGSSASFSEMPNVSRPSVGGSKGRLIVTPDNLLVGKVAKVNVEARFVILTFPIGHLPTLDQRLSVYRQGLKTGELRVTGPQLDDNVVADVVAGEAQAGDEVRAQ